MKFLLIKLKHIGDTLLLTPTLRALRSAFPTAQIDVVVRRGCQEILENNPDISHVFVTPPPGKTKRTFQDFRREQRVYFQLLTSTRYDYAFDLSNSDRAVLLMLAARAKCRVVNDAAGDVGRRRLFYNRFSKFNWQTQHQALKDFHTVADQFAVITQPGPLVYHPKISVPEIQAKFPALKTTLPIAIVHPTSRWAFKQWFPERWVAVADQLKQQQGLTVAFTSGPSDEERSYVSQILAAARESHLNFSGRTSLDELARLQSLARIFLGVDTLAMHMAAAMQTPSVALFGPSSEWSWHPWQCRHELVLGDCPCKKTRVFTCDKSRPYPCMDRISVEAVLLATAKLLENTPHSSHPIA